MTNNRLFAFIIINKYGYQIPAAADQSGDSDLGGSSGQGLLKRARENDRREYCGKKESLLQLLFSYNGYTPFVPPVYYVSYSTVSCLPSRAC